MNFTTLPDERGKLPDLFDVPEWVYDETPVPESIDGAIAQIRAINLEIESVRDAIPLLDEEFAKKTCRHKMRLLHGQKLLIDAWITENSDRGDALERAEARNLAQQKHIANQQYIIDRRDQELKWQKNKNFELEQTISALQSRVDEQQARIEIQQRLIDKKRQSQKTRGDLELERAISNQQKFILNQRKQLAALNAALNNSAPEGITRRQFGKAKNETVFLRKAIAELSAFIIPLIEGENKDQAEFLLSRLDESDVAIKAVQADLGMVEA